MSSYSLLNLALRTLLSVYIFLGVNVVKTSETPVGQVKHNKENLLPARYLTDTEVPSEHRHTSVLHI